MPDPAERHAMSVLAELEPKAEELLRRHLSMAEEWFPHDYVPWSKARDFQAEPWSEEQSSLTPEARCALEISLLTEDNLPSYHRIIYNTLGRGDAWMTWVGRWTAEEARHAVVLRDYLVVTRGVEPVTLERDRMKTMTTGYEREFDGIIGAFAYGALQELATRISHQNTGRVAQDPIAERLCARVAQDENLHMVFYRDVVSAALDLHKNESVVAIAKEIESFTMPGEVIPHFTRRAARMAYAGVYDLRLHRDAVIAPLLRHWRVFELSGLDPAAERAREGLAKQVADLDERARRFEEWRAQRSAREERTG